MCSSLGQLVGFTFYRRHAAITRVRPLEPWNPTRNRPFTESSPEPRGFPSSLPVTSHCQPPLKALSSQDLAPREKQQFPGSGFTSSPPAHMAGRPLTACLEGRQLETQFSPLHFFPHNYCNPCLKLLIRSSSSNEMPDLSAWIRQVSSLLYSKWKKPKPNQNKEGQLMKISFPVTQMLFVSVFPAAHCKNG